MRQGKAPYTTATFTPFRNTESAMPHFPMLHFRHAGGGGVGGVATGHTLTPSHFPANFGAGGGGCVLGGGGECGAGWRGRGHPNPNKGDKIKAGPKEGRNATSPLHSRGSLNKCGQNQSGLKRGRRCYITPAFWGSTTPSAGRKSELATSPLPSRGPKSGRKCYITHPFSGVPNNGDKIKVGPKEGGHATSPLHSRGSPTPSAGRKSEVATSPPAFSGAQRRAEMLHHPCILRASQQRGQNQSGPKGGRKCYITPAFSGVPNKGDKIKAGPEEGRNATSPCILRGPQTNVDKIKVGPKEGGDATSPLHFGGSPTPSAGRKSELATSPLSSRGPKRGRKCYITPAFSGVPSKGDKIKVGSNEGGDEMLHHPCILGGPVRQARGENQRWLPHPCLLGVPKEGENATSPCILGGPQQRGQNQSRPKGGRKGCITPAFSGVPKQMWTKSELAA